MPRVTHVKKARKAIPDHGIAVGDSYYWWAFRVGGRGSIKKFSKTPPKRQQLTQSSFLISLYDIEDSITGLAADDTLPDMIADIAQQLRDLGEECQGSLDNMPDGLREGDTGQMLQERASMCESAADELENIETDEGSANLPDREDCEDDDDYENQCEEARQEFWESVLSEVQSVNLDY